MDNQTALDQHYAIFVATLDYLLNEPAPRIIVDEQNPFREHYDKLKQRAEKHYRNGNLPLLQRVIRQIGWSAPRFKNDSFLAYIKDRTGYEGPKAEIAG
jgi:hypothetical protein